MASASTNVAPATLAPASASTDRAVDATDGDSDHSPDRGAGLGDDTRVVADHDERPAKPVDHQALTFTSDSLSSDLVRSIPDGRLLKLPELPQDDDDDDDDDDSAEKGDGKYVFTNASGDVKSYLDLSIPTLTGMLLNNAVEITETKADIKDNSFEKTLHDAATNFPEETYVVNTCNLLSKALVKIRDEHTQESMDLFVMTINALTHHFHGLPSKLSRLESTKEIIQDAISELEDKAEHAARTRKRTRRDAKLKDAEDDAEKSLVARRKSKSPNGSSSKR